MSVVLTERDVLILVPAFNEAASIGDVINELKMHSYDILVISDGSTDATAQIARASGARVLDLPINLGVGGALRAGFRLAVTENYGAVVQVDADGQHPANEITDLITAANEHQAHMVIGSRLYLQALQCRLV
jgi:glycosyltransferase involved in cell wall biosynthesis